MAYDRVKRHQAYLKTKDAVLSQSREWYEANLDRALEARRSYKERERVLAITALGGRCVRCGFDDSRALQFDHINGGGRKERTTTHRVPYFRAIARGERPDIQLLCANCNCIKRIENDEHGNLRRSRREAVA